jgi:AcrR family transcriptional regulator
MAARPRIASDADLLMAAARAVSRIGPSRLTLAHVAAEAGVVPATLVQRFGSKRGLLLALIQHGAAGTTDEMARLRAAHPSPLAALLAFGECMAGMAPTPEELANHLAYLVMDLTDPEFHRLALEQARVFRDEVKGLVDSAVIAGELKPCDTAGLARLLQETVHGALLTWAIWRQKTAQEWVRHELELLLAPYVANRRNRSSSRKPNRKRK